MNIKFCTQEQYIKRELQRINEVIPNKPQMEFYYIGRRDAFKDILERLEDEIWGTEMEDVVE